MTKGLFLQLLQVALGTRDSLDRALTAEEWESMYEMAKVQAVVGLMNTAFARLPKDQWPPRMMLFKWAPQAKHVEDAHTLHVEVLCEVHEALKQEGIGHVFMKGLTCGARYPKPESRTCGDIDFLVSPDNFVRTMAVMDRIGRADHNSFHEQHGTAYVKSVTLEPHYKLHNFQSPANDRAMDAVVKECWPKDLRYVRVSDSGGKNVCTDVPVLPPECEGVFLLGHMVDHVYSEGLGLRQVIDFMTWATSCATDTTFDKEKHLSYLKKVRMERPHRIFVRICEKYLGMDTSIFGYDYSPKEMAFADKMMEDILCVGNFGHGDREFHTDGWYGFLQNYLWVVRRAYNLAYLCPSEAYMWPVSKFTRYFDKKMHPGRYQVPQ